MRLVNGSPANTAPRGRPAELVAYGRHAVIVVNPTPTLKQRTGVELVPLPDGRALISFDRARTIAALELTIADALEDHSLSRPDQAVFRAIAEILRTARRSNDVTLLQRNIIVLEARRQRTPSNGKGRPPEPASRAKRPA